MGQFLITAPDGTKYRVQGPDGATAEQALAQVQAQHQPVATPAATTTAPQPTSIVQSPSQKFANNPVTEGVGEAALNVGTGTVALPISGLVGLAALVGHKMGLTNADPADVIRAVQGALTYEPKTAAGKATTAAVTYPFRKLSEGAEAAGAKVADVTGSPALGTAVNTAIQFAPAILAHTAGRIGAAAEGSEAPAAVNPEQAAQDYVAQRTHLDWNSLSDAVKSRLTQIAQDADTLGKLDPAAVERQARLESLPIPIKATAGQITRNTAQLNNEGTLAATTAGAPLKAIRDAQHGALIQNLQVLKGKVAPGAATTPEQVGLSVQDAALRTKLKLQQQKVKDLYQKAEDEGELQGNVSTRPLANLIEQSPDLTHLGWVQNWLNKMNVVTDQTGADMKGMRLKASVKELEDLRQAAVARAMNGGTEGYYAGKVINAIDSATDGAGGDAYKAARAARKAQALEFEDQGAVARLVENKSRTDRATALEDTWRQTVKGGSIADLQKVKQSLLTGGNEETQAAGAQAWRDLRAQTLQHIIDESTKGSAPLPDGSPAVSAAGMKRAIDGIGPAKLETLFGKGTVSKINQILQATQDVRTEPPRVHPGSSTVGNIVAFLERGIGKVPVLGDTASGVVRGAIKLHEMGRAGRETLAAQHTPLDAAARAAPKAAKRAARADELKASLRRGSGALPASMAAQQYLQRNR